MMSMLIVVAAHETGVAGARRLRAWICVAGVVFAGAVAMLVAAAVLGGGESQSVRATAWVGVIIVAAATAAGAFWVAIRAGLTRTAAMVVALLAPAAAAAIVGGMVELLASLV
jgi:hypothetical protein